MWRKMFLTEKQQSSADRYGSCKHAQLARNFQCLWSVSLKKTQSFKNIRELPYRCRNQKKKTEWQKKYFREVGKNAWLCATTFCALVDICHARLQIEHLANVHLVFLPLSTACSSTNKTGGNKKCKLITEEEIFVYIFCVKSNNC